MWDYLILCLKTAKGAKEKDAFYFTSLPKTTEDSENHGTNWMEQAWSNCEGHTKENFSSQDYPEPITTEILKLHDNFVSVGADLVMMRGYLLTWPGFFFQIQQNVCFERMGGKVLRRALRSLDWIEQDLGMEHRSYYTKLGEMKGYPDKLLFRGLSSTKQGYRFKVHELVLKKAQGYLAWMPNS